MKKLLIRGGKKLEGEVAIAGAKNAALPLMVASILTDEKLTLTNVPHVADIATMANLLENLGVTITFDGNDPDLGWQGRAIIFDAGKISSDPIAPYDLVRKMRASIFALGPLLARCGKAKISLPGGCAIGTRPVDLHLKAMEKLGAKIELKGGYIEAHVEGKLRGAEIIFEKVSVGATESAMMAASLARGKTTIINAACEPEIIDLAKCLNAMGAKITGAGTPQISIEGVEKLHAARHKIIADRIEAGTYAIAAGITDGRIILRDVEMWVMSSFKQELYDAGIALNQISANAIEVKRISKNIRPVSITTNPFPGFPTDMQAQFMALMTIANGASTIEETIFENRFMHVMELQRMGANIESHGNIAVVKGVEKLTGAEVMATDLRASVCLVLAALIAEGETIINRLYHLERGYERLAEKLIACGADIKILY
ncbi:MAG: UDP-N-acetylglucosamine 1-carboxyvinyltransferase [Alphaproteobacteria bacterium RIFCSPLOWO2_01_FULL_40_26]|nr:MAG: UDP-N-acetylglucosamine 1-carboxyvinyltransferase [Alphaproteobacteria bacterium RIFCSPHIGHO2_02_FULL_40_34]OFW94495.1 MAG: UDP-N-acetylglucosamine 1-carboxyvinyltransferase [Alphaproteobacteria bacterium RIFCSPLOWO2_01_FULL_40_26]OFX10206.1 MAG: UDP-N-acetylglucosamine 1-carboxyvinyltransferase [Alphaproteobacteria bacterium RIFCSPLOWO2_02_FULL_40_19]